MNSVGKKLANTYTVQFICVNGYASSLKIYLSFLLATCRPLLSQHYISPEPKVFANITLIMNWELSLIAFWTWKR